MIIDSNNVDTSLLNSNALGGSSLASIFTKTLALTAGLFTYPQQQGQLPLMAIDHSVNELVSPIVLDNGMTCPIDLPLSCSNDTTVHDLCCFEYPGGVILLTQFWDYAPSTGPLDEFTMHGLWPDNCDGSFEQFCDNGLEIHNPREIVKFHDEELLKEMDYFWKDMRGQDEQFWTHEYNKHGTCYTTIKPSCYGEEKYRDRVDVYDFFKAAVELHKTLPTFKFLSDEGIVPSLTETYSKEQILGALRKNFGGFEPYVKCDRNNAINEIWYFHHLQGNLKSGKFNRIDSFNQFRCPDQGIKFIPKNERPVKPTRTLHPPRPKPTGNAPNEVGFIKLTGEGGCLIRNGKWYYSGTCATYQLFNIDSPKNNGTYTGDKILLKSNGGFCGVDPDDKFVCSQRIKPTEFLYDEETGLISTDTDNSDFWSADRRPYGRAQVDVKNIKGGNIEFKLKFVKKW